MANEPRWRTTQTSYIGHSLVLEGDEVNYTPPEGGQVAENLEPVNEEAQAWIDAQVDAHPSKTVKGKAKPKGQPADDEVA